MYRAIFFAGVLAYSTISSWAAPSGPPAAPPADVLKVDYFSNAHTQGAPDAILRLTNPGTSNGGGGGTTSAVDATSGGNVCAYIAVFDVNQEMSECCGCLLTPDGLRTLSVNLDLTSNPLTGRTLQTGVIKIASAVPLNNTCPLPGQVAQRVLEPAVRSWATHIVLKNSGGTTGNVPQFAVTETASRDATMSAGEAYRLYTQCAAIVLDGSGAGICSCGKGD